jgi:putative OPT family oligopeptide transporter
MDIERRSLPEITVKAVVLGVILSVVLAAANAYLGLFAGMTVSASIPAAVVSMGVLRLFRRSNILENNIVQTAASAGESLAAGVIFTLPALVLLNFWSEFSFVWVVVIAGFGGVLGVLFTIPLRRALIIEAKLKFPEGVATAEVLKAGERGGSGIKYITQAAIAGGLFKFAQAGLQIWKGTFEVARRIGGTVGYFGSSLSPALLAVGYIVGLNIAVLVFVGGLCNWLIAVPICAAFENSPMADEKSLLALEWAHQIWATRTRYIGVGGMVVGGLWTIFKMRTSILSGIKSGLRAYRGVKGQPVELPRTEKDMPMKWILVLIAASAAPLFLLYQTFVGQVTVSLPMALTMLVMGFVFSAVAGYMGGLVGSSNNPISGVTIATVLFSSLLLFLLMGTDAENGPAAAIIIGSVVCCAASIAGDNLQDLKAGYIVGATPWRQQVMQIVGTVSAALVMAPVLTLLLKAYGFAGHSSATENALAAPQANLMASVAQGVFAGRLPWSYVFIGMVVAVAVILLDNYLEHKGSSFRAPVLAVAIGFYLPFKLEVPIFVGGIIHEIVRRRHAVKDASKVANENSGQQGLLFASGLITGEALVGVALAIPIVISARQDVLAVLDKPLGAWLGICLLVGVGYWLYRTALRYTKS